MDCPSDNVASALRIAGVLSAQLKPGLTAIKNAKNVTQACGCGKMAEGFGKPCLQPVCAACSRDECPECKGPASTPNGKCPKHRGPPCPHKYCTVKGSNGFRGETSNGAVLFEAVSEHIDHISELLDHLIVLTKDM
ncbi:hypothetical protein K525DRAFT_268478 [Schizophyllum commune Loenen D]|nr:hypothetical protein K525DRAFT_268478 [Schizophyllum commune Loenen D]